MHVHRSAELRPTKRDRDLEVRWGIPGPRDGAAGNVPWGTRRGVRLRRPGANDPPPHTEPRNPHAVRTVAAQAAGGDVR